MHYTDRVYGKVEMTEPVMLDLIHAPALQRLKDIDQAGYSEIYFPGSSHSRFEHSVGVSILLKKYGAPLPEQIAGLIHDVSHAAFSHCIDYVLSEGSEKEQTHQDDIFDAFVKKSEIPEILISHGFDPEYILDHTHFPLKETELPDLCADRIDYSLRGACMYKEIENADYVLDHLTAKDGRWIFKNFESAKKYAELFHSINTTYYAGLRSAVMFQTLGDYLRYALSKAYISEADLYATDRHVLEKIEPYITTDPVCYALYTRMHNPKGVKNDPNDYDAKIFCKSRVVDPWCFEKGEIKRVSEIETTWRDTMREESKPKEYFLKFDV